MIAGVKSAIETSIMEISPSSRMACVGVKPGWYWCFKLDDNGEHTDDTSGLTYKGPYPSQEDCKDAAREMVDSVMAGLRLPRLEIVANDG